jgi:tRNA (guanine10-N2)-dimethyltransferase
MDLIRGRRIRFRHFDLVPKVGEPNPADFLRGIDAAVDLREPEYELTLVRGNEDYLVVTSPLAMRQGWSLRRPRRRSFFHPSAIFPKLSRALVNISRCKEGEVFLDPFAGTGSLSIEASIIGAKVVNLDRSEKMARGALANMKGLSQEWLGVLRADSTSPPLAMVDAIATDIPYGRVSSTRGRRPRDILDTALSTIGVTLSPGAVMVIMHPKDVQIEETPGFLVEEEHHLHVHKLLTRTITVLRRL